MFETVALEGVLAIGLSLSIPIVAILMVFISSMKKKKHDTELRLALIQAGTDADTAKILIEEPHDKHEKYGPLRMGCFFAGAALGALCNGLFEVSSDDIYFWMAIAGGVGVGLIIAFVIEYKLSKKEQEGQKEGL